MSRRSIRLETSRYYDIKGEPSVTYRETVYRISTKRRTRHLSQPEGQETPNNKRGNRRFVFFVFSLGFGLSYLTLLLSSNFLDAALSESPVSPLIRTTDPTEQCREMEKHLGELQDEVLRLKKQINYLLPAADILPNFALESLGAKVVSHLSSEAYQTSTTIFGIPIGTQSVHPGTVIQGNSPLLPGHCWAFSGEQGHLVIALSHQITISHVTLGHISKDMSPTGSIKSAPKEFTIYAMENLDDEGTQLGTYLYDHEGDAVQTFKIPDNKQGVFHYVRLQVESNWGHPDYTCLYSFRVHGKLADN